MNDRFKFRVFIPDKKNSKNGLTGMFKVHSLHTGTNKAIITSLYGNCSIKLENNILMQCTGLKDKNGKLIYEGDVIKYLGGTVNNKFVKYITKWNDNIGQFYISKINPSEYDNWKDWHLARHDLDYEVIGNIYENKELLEDKGYDR